MAPRCGHHPIIILRISFWVLIVAALHQMELISASRCVVSSWRPWSECMGGCDFAQRVRNRDVIRPAFPERNPLDGQLYLRECPPLYEVENCTPRECEDESPFAKPPSLRSLPIFSSRELENAARNKHNKAGAKGVALPTNESANNIGGSNRTSNQIKSANDETTRKSNDPKRARLAGTNVFFAPANRTDCNHKNHRCCKLTRTICPDGTKPKQLIRWFRLKDEPFCRAFHYPYCGTKIEAVELPLAAENACTELCFSSAEKTILSSLRII
ncbi:hypothetical protein Ddc_05336 [Ditylenchus destructor]|nr:hypothetical protein Ddc_05336 [Ditylenchus destructor]